MFTSNKSKTGPSPWGKRANMDFILFDVIWDKKKDGGLVLGELWSKVGPSKRGRTILGHGTGIFG